jgi:hypothetical protein
MHKANESVSGLSFVIVNAETVSKGKLVRKASMVREFSKRRKIGGYYDLGLKEKT